MDVSGDVLWCPEIKWLSRWLKVMVAVGGS